MTPEQQAAIDAANAAAANAVKTAQTVGQSRGDLANAKTANQAAETAWSGAQNAVTQALQAVVDAFSPAAGTGPPTTRLS